MTLKSFQDKVSADHNIAANDFHYYYFLYTLLQMKLGDTVGLEVKDDIHIDLSNGKQILIQVKHSIQKNKNNQTINLTELDNDLWKTLYNWKNMINDKSQNRISLESQIKYINNTIFILTSNKSYSSSNKFLVILEKFKNKEVRIEDLTTYLTELKDKTKDLIIKDYIDYLLDSPPNWLSCFFENLEFKLDEENIIDRIKDTLRENHIPDYRIDQVFHRIDSNIRLQNYFHAKNRSKILLTFNEFQKLIIPHFEEVRNQGLVIKNRTENFSGNPLDQLFIKQLLDIEIVETDNLFEIIELTNKKMLAYTNFKNWEHEGSITTLQKKEFDNTSIEKWKIEFNSQYRKIKRKLKKGNCSIDEDELLDAAQALYDTLLKYNLNFCNTELGPDISNGQFYLLADKPSIGWKIDWENEYGI